MSNNNDNKRNLYLLFIDSVLYVNAMSFISVNAVIPNFLSSLGAGTFQIGLAGALVSIGPFISQPIFAHLAMARQVKTRFFSGLLFVQRFIFLFYVLLIPVFHRISAHLSIQMFLVFWFIFNLFVGCYSPFYMSIVYKVIPSNQTGRLFGFSVSAGNALALASAITVGVFMKKLTFPGNYTWILLIGTMLLMLDALIFVLVREQPEETKSSAFSYMRFLREIPAAFKGQAGFRDTVLGNCFIVMANAVLAFYSLAAIRNYNTGPENVAIFTGVSILVNIFGSIVFGIIADKYGHRQNLRVAAFLGMLASIIVIGIQSIYAVYTAFALSSLCYSGHFISSNMTVIGSSPKDKIALHTSINVMITLILSSLVTVLGGILIDMFSFMPLYVITGISALAGFLVLNRNCRRQQEAWNPTTNL